MIKRPLQRSGSDSTAEFAVGTGKQMRVRQMQYPNRIIVTFRRGLNRRLSSVAVMLSLVRAVFSDADVLGLFV